MPLPTTPQAVGGSAIEAILALANPSAVSFLHVNASNVPTWMTAANYRTALGLGTGDSPTFAGLNGPAGKGTLNLSVGGSFGELAWNGVSNIQWAGGTVNLTAPSIRLGDNTYVYLIPSANTLYQRNGTNAQTFLLANTYTNDSNYERAIVGWSGNALQFGTQMAGTGLARPLQIVTGGVLRFTFNTDSSFSLPSSATMVWGGGGAIYGTGSLLNLRAGASNLVVVEGASGAGGGALGFINRGRIIPVNDGIFRLSNNADNGFTRLEFGTSLLGISRGTGSPEGVVTALVGSLYIQTDGGASTTLYVKESGTGNTGWVAK